MNDRASTLIRGRRERLERALGRRLGAPVEGSREPLTEDNRAYLKDEAVDLYWNELEWEHITEEEVLDQGRLTSQAFPGLLAYVRGLLLDEVMPDAMSPANPRPEVVEDVLGFLAGRVLELEDGFTETDSSEGERVRAELDLTSGLIDQVLYLYHRLGSDDIERVEEASHAAG